jgi:DUF917 family protein
MRKLGLRELKDVVMGAGLLGAGGGGSTAEGMKLAERVLSFGPCVELAQCEEIADHDWGAVIAGVGSPSASLQRVRTHSPGFALELLESTCSFKSSFVIPFETGAGNSLNPMLAAVQRRIPIVDGDPVGRAVPELQMTTFSLACIPLSPLALATEDGTTVVIRAVKAIDTERISRAITAEMGGVSAIACHAMRGRDMKDAVIPGTTTLAERLGRAIRQAQSARRDVIESLFCVMPGCLLGRGEITSLRAETKGGFDFGVAEVDGDLPLRVLYKNENMLAFRGEELAAIVPDLICSIDDEGNPLTNADLRQGMKISYLGFPASAGFRTPAAFDLFHPILEALGYHGGFVPLEKLPANVR